MARHYLARITLPGRGGLPEDVIVNDLSFEGPDVPDEAQLELLVYNTIVPFYTGAASDGVGVYLSNFVLRDVNASIVSIYQRPVLPGLLGSPIWERPFTPPPANSAADLPEEICVVASFNGVIANIPEEQEAGGVITRPKARRRGRIYFGPLTLPALTDELTLPTRVSAGLIAALNGAMQNLHTNAQAVGWTWEVWSTVNYAGQAVIGGHVDNAFDVQRRRGPKATSRTAWVA